MTCDTNFDIIIIGAGTAGCVLANRLSEDPALNILILEAGEEHNDDSRVKCPGASGSLLGDSDLDWQFESEPQHALNGRSVHHPRGKLVGGSSAINSHALVYPSKENMDAWASAELGNPGWDWEHLEPYFKKFQTINQPASSIEEEKGIDLPNGHSSLTGPIQASYPLAPSKLRTAWIDTFQKLDCLATGGPLSSDGVGALTTTSAIESGSRERSHAGVAYFEAARSRSNLLLYTNALVKRIIFEERGNDGLIASGVQYTLSGRICTARTRGQVLVCAGAFQSPQILELSGIGGEELLQSKGIDCLYHNPKVGENLQDHIMCSISAEVADGVQTSDSYRGAAHAQQFKEEFQAQGTGPLAEAAHNFAYQSLDLLSSPSEMAEIRDLAQRLTGPTLSPTNHFGLHTVTSSQSATATILLISIQRHLDRGPRIADMSAKHAPEDYLSLNAMLAHPFSRGSVHIQSPSAAKKPAVDFGYLTHPLDIELLARHMMDLERLLSQEPLASLVKKDGKRLAASFPRMTNLEDAKRMIRACAHTNYHPAGTCSMMAESVGGVVDPTLRVYGTTNVRVCDASMMPVMPRGNILATVYAVAEKAADIVKESMREQRERSAGRQT